jgi:PAS domain S-box-containing protein
LTNNNNLKSFIVHTDLHGKILEANEFFSDILGKPAQNLAGESIFHCLTCCCSNFSADALAPLLNNSTVIELQTSFIIPQAFSVNWQITQRQKQNNKEKFLEWLGKACSIKLDVINKPVIPDMYKALFTNSPQPMFIYGANQKLLLDANQAAMDFLGLDKASLLSKSKSELVLPGDAIAVPIEYNEMPASLIMVNGKKLEKPLNPRQQAAGQDFRAMADTAPVMIWISDENDRTVFVNNFWTSFTGIKYEDALGLGIWNNIIHPEDICIGIDEYRIGFAERKTVSLEYRLKHHSGEYRWVLDNAIPRFLDDGSFLGFIGSVVDIHDRKLNEEKIRFQANLIENITDIIISTDEHLNIVTWNRIAEQTLGIKAVDAINRTIEEIQQLGVAIEIPANARETLKEFGNWTGELKYQPKIGDPIYLHCTVSELRNETNDIVTGYVSISSDITEKRKAEDAVKKSELFYKSLIADSSNGIVLTDAEGGIQFAFPSVYTILGFIPEELIGKNIFEFVYNDDLQISQSNFLDEVRHKAKEQSISIRLRKKTNDYVWCTVQGYNMFKNENVQAFVIHFSDDTRRKDMEQALQEREKSFRLLSENSKDIICLHDIDGTVLYASPSVTRLLGYLPQDLVGKSAFDYFHSEDACFDSPCTKGRLRKFANNNVQFRIRKANGSFIWLETTTQPIYNNNRRMVSLQTSSRDITDRMVVMQELRKKEQEFRNLSAYAPSIIQRLDNKYRFTYCNQRFTKLLGTPVASILQKTPAETGLYGVDLAIFMKAVRKVFKQNTIETIKIQQKDKQGQSLSFIVTIAPEPNEQGIVESILAISSNITEMNQVQELLITKEEELQQSNERFELVTRASTDAIWEVNTATGYVYTTFEFTNRFGYFQEDLKGKDQQWFIERLHPEDRLSVISKITQNFTTQERFWKDEFRWRCKDGTYTYIHNQAYIFYDENEKPYRAIGAIQDISGRKRVESQMIQKDILLAASADAANELLTTRNTSTAIHKSLQIIGAAAKVDRAYIFQFQYNADLKENYFKLLKEWNSGNFESQVNNEELKYLPEYAFPEIFDRIKEGLHTDVMVNRLESPLLRKHLQKQQIKSMLLMPIFVQNIFWGFAGFDQCSYERIWMNVELDILKVFVSNLASVFERREGERKLIESEIKFKTLFQNSLDVVCLLDKRAKIKYVTPSVTSVLGYPEDSLINKFGFNLVHPDDAARLKKLVRDLNMHPDVNATMDIRVQDHQQKWIWMEAKGINKFADPIINGAIFNFHDISDRKQSEQQLQGYSEHITNILNSITDGFIALDKDFNILWWNPIAEQLTGIKDVQVLGKNLWKALPQLKRTISPKDASKAISSKTGTNFEIYISSLKNYFDVNAYPSQQGLFVYFKDITYRKNQEILLSLEKDVLELNTNPTASLKTTIDHFLEGLEALSPGMSASVLLLEENGKTVRHLSAPSLPKHYCLALDGLTIGPNVGSCGTAMHYRKIVISSNIITDPAWVAFRELVTACSILSCWSFPIVTSSNSVLGSFACYFSTKLTPNDEQMQLYKRVATLLGVIIDNKQAEQKINISNERYLLATKATNDAIWDYDIRQAKTYWGESFFTQFGYKAEDYMGNPDFWESKIHPAERKRMKERYDKAIKDKERGVLYSEYRFLKANNQYALVTDRAFIVYDNNMEAARLVGSMQDITERRKLEEKVLKQEINKQKSIAQAVVDAQEKERAEIGKELHDNVNQILSTAKLYLELAKSDTKQRDELIKRSSDSIFNAINEIRHISKALVPPSVKDLGLIDSIKDLVESLRMTGALAVKFNHSGDFDNIISDKQKLMLFRIIQEQVNNVLKHAEASQIIITLKLADQTISLAIEDNGKGFDLEKIKFKKGVGLSNIESRAQLFNCKVTITTALQKGCKLLIQVPIHEH